MKKWLAILFVLFPTLSFAHQPLEKFETLSPPFQTKKGEALFQDNGCTLCHGENGAGNGPMAEDLKNKPRNFRDYSEMHRMPDIRMEQAIKNGLEGTAMPAFSDLSEMDIRNLVAYIHSFLADSHTEIDMCLFETVVLDAQPAPKGFRIALDEPERLDVKVQGGKIRVTLKNWDTILGNKIRRTHFRIMNEDRIYSLVTVKIRPCLNRLEQIVKESKH